ncbi:MAG: hypothetical protein QOI66_3717 [Myxococcales bacterium]|nr:hypothetical protein [Myxococcales bacterium]
MKINTLNVILSFAIFVGASGACESRDDHPGRTAQTEALTAARCASLNGEPITDPGDGQTERRGCPDGRRKLGPLETGAEGGLCCEILPVLSIDQCQARPQAEVINDPGDGSVHRAGCPFPKMLVGAVNFGAEGGICCRTLNFSSISDCEARGGHEIGDPGDGSVYRDLCPAGESLLGAVEKGAEGGICCSVDSHLP